MKTYNYIIITILTVFPFGNSLWAQAPTDLQIDGGNSDSVNENRLTAAIVGRLTTIDPNLSDTHRYMLVAGAGDTNNASFSINGDRLLTAEVFDFETQNNYSIRIRTTDSANLSYEEALTISINNIEVESSTATTTVWDLNATGSYTLSPTAALALNTGIVQLNTGFFTASDISFDTGDSRGAAFGDVDGDGDMDIYVANYNNQQNKLWINDGSSGSFTNNDITNDIGFSQAATFGDVDGDGDLDLYVANVNQQNELWINDGSGSFAASDIASDTGNSVDAAFGDVDGDGDLDLYVVNLNEQNKLWINDGSGSFTDNDILNDNTVGSFAATFGDVDGDGDLDLYVANSGPQNKLWINNGSGSFTDNDISGDTGNSLDAVFGDMDSDGDLDLYVANDGQNRLWINDGSGNFTASDITSDTGTSWGAAFGDVDSDGDLDIYVANDGQNRLWINNGSGSFTTSGIASETRNSQYATFGDVDGDGDLDIYVANDDGQQNKLLINGYSTDQPYITANTTQSFTSSLTGFTEVLSTNNQGSVTYQISIDNGTSWQYWNGSTWTVTTKTDGTETSSAIIINTNIATLATVGGNFLWRAYLESNGPQRVELDQVELAFQDSVETSLTLSGNTLIVEDTNGGTSNNDLSLSVSGTLLLIEETINSLGGAGSFITNQKRSFPLSSISSITINTHSGIDTVTLLDDLHFSGYGSLRINGNAIVLQKGTVMLEQGTLSYQVSRSISLPSGGGIIATGSSTIEMLSRYSITLNASIRNTSTDTNNTIYLVSGWDGTTSFSPTSFNGYSSVSSLTGTTPFGNNGAFILLGDGSQTTSVTVGSRYGHTGLYGYSILLTGGQGGSNRFAQLGYTTSDQGSIYTVSGTLILRAKQNLRLVGGGDAQTFNYSQVGHVGADTSSDTTTEATVTGFIDCAIGNEIYLSGGSPLSNYSQLGHGGYNALGIYNGVYILHTPEISIKLIDNGGQGYSRLGND